LNIFEINHINKELSHAYNRFDHHEKLAPLFDDFYIRGIIPDEV
jgi:hypothetical protein